MEKKEKKNNGFTLIELIVALAILAILMTGVSSLMGIGVFNYRKVKADVSLQTTAQDTYTRLSDSIMQANTIVIEGWTSPSTIPFNKKGEDVADTVSLKYYVLNEEIKNDFVRHPEAYGIYNRYGAVMSGNVELFSSLDPDTTLYITAIGIRRGTEIDESLIPTLSGSGENRTATDKLSLTNEVVKIADDKGLFKDTVVDFFVFDNENLYYGIGHRFMTDADDTVDLSDETSKKNHMYTKALSYVNAQSSAGTVSIPGVTAKIDAVNGSIEFNMVFNDLNATFTSDGKTSPRNSYVIKDKRSSGSAGASDEGTSEDSSSEDTSEEASSEEASLGE